MDLIQIKKAVDNSVIIHWKNDNYVVVKDEKLNEYNVLSRSNKHIVGLTYKSDKNKCTHNLKDFYICPMDCEAFKESIS